MISLIRVTLAHAFGVKTATSLRISLRAKTKKFYLRVGGEAGFARSDLDLLFDSVDAFEVWK